jgi:hypothetical protein
LESLLGSLSSLKRNQRLCKYWTKWKTMYVAI